MCVYVCVFQAHPGEEEEGAYDGLEPDWLEVSVVVLVWWVVAAVWRWVL